MSDDAETVEETPQEEASKGDRLTAIIQERQSRRSETTDLRNQVNELQTKLGQMSPAEEKPSSWKNPYDPTDQPTDHLRAEIEHLTARMDTATSSVQERMQAQDQQEALNTFERNTTAELTLAAEQEPVLAEAHQFIVKQFSSLAKAQGARGAELANSTRNAMLQGYLNAAGQGKDVVTATVEMAQAFGFESEPVKPAKARGQQAAAQSLGAMTGSSGVAAPADLGALTKMSRSELTKDNGANMARLNRMLRGEQ